MTLENGAAPAVRLRHNDPNVLFENFDDEVVAVHLGTGVYHSMLGTAGDIFAMLRTAPTRDELEAVRAAGEGGNLVSVEGADVCCSVSFRRGHGGLHRFEQAAAGRLRWTESARKAVGAL